MDPSSSTSAPRISNIGLSTLHDRQDAIIDIIFVHGLQGHPRKTWTCERIPGPEKGLNETSDRGIKRLLFSWKHKKVTMDAHKSEADDVFWPYDLLREDCTRSRILTWGYDSKVSHFFSGAANQSNITAYARNLLHALKVSRVNCQGRGIIFVAHSLGGNFSRCNH